MARFTSSTFGKISGKHGTAVAAVRKDGLCILKVYRVASNPNTVGQKSQRGKFGFVMKELNCMRKLFTETYGGQYGINKAVSQAMKTCVTGEFPDFKLHYNLLVLSGGNVDLPQKITADSLPHNRMIINWDSTLFSQSHSDDVINIVFLNHSIRHMAFHQCVAARNQGSFETTLPRLNTTDKIHGWAYFSLANNRENSKSIYLGEF
ncbi:MAG: DUF6266 family protein [Paludibacter sp.]|nr:DUF6266 family protein [Paludibacter sp.]